MLRAPETRGAQHLEGVRASAPRAAVENDVAVPGDRIDVALELSKRNQPRTFQISLARLEQLADVDQERIAQLPKLCGNDFTCLHRTAESFVIDELCDGRVLAADGAIRILLQLQPAKLHPQRIKEKQPSDERLADSREQLDCLRRLDRADHARKYA